MLRAVGYLRRAPTSSAPPRRLARSPLMPTPLCASRPLSRQQQDYVAELAAERELKRKRLEVEMERRRVAEENIFLYSHRKAGKGYTKFANDSMRGYTRLIWPPFRKLKLLALPFLASFLLAIFVDPNWLSTFFKHFLKSYRSEAGSRSVGSSESDEPKDDLEKQSDQVQAHHSEIDPLTHYTAQ